MEKENTKKKVGRPLKDRKDKEEKDKEEGEENKSSWIDAMIEREATPPELRKEVNQKFCKKWEVPESTYYYHAAKPENQEKIIALALNYAKRHTSEILENLGVRAKSDNKAAELFIKFILQLAEKIDNPSATAEIEKLRIEIKQWLNV